MDEVQRLKDQITHLEHKVWLLEDALGRASDNPHWCTQCREFVVYKPGGSTRPTPFRSKLENERMTNDLEFKLYNALCDCVEELAWLKADKMPEDSCPRKAYEQGLALIEEIRSLSETQSA